METCPRWEGPTRSDSRGASPESTPSRRTSRPEVSIARSDVFDALRSRKSSITTRPTQLRRVTDASVTFDRNSRELSYSENCAPAPAHASDLLSISDTDAHRALWRTSGRCPCTDPSQPHSLAAAPTFRLRQAGPSATEVGIRRILLTGHNDPSFAIDSCQVCSIRYPAQ
jgi:hypothetical protein